MKDEKIRKTITNITDPCIDIYHDGELEHQRNRIYKLENCINGLCFLLIKHTDITLNNMGDEL